MPGGRCRRPALPRSALHGRIGVRAPAYFPAVRRTPRAANSCDREEARQDVITSMVAFVYVPYAVPCPQHRHRAGHLRQPAYECSGEPRHRNPCPVGISHPFVVRMGCLLPDDQLYASPPVVARGALRCGRAGVDRRAAHSWVCDRPPAWTGAAVGGPREVGERRGTARSVAQLSAAGHATTDRGYSAARSRCDWTSTIARPEVSIAMTRHSRLLGSRATGVCATATGPRRGHLCDERARWLILLSS